MRTTRSLGLAGAVAVVAVVVAGAPARADQLTGIVNAVNLDGSKLVVKEKVTDKNYDLAVTPQTSIVTNRGQALSLKNLKRGDGVGITYSGGVATAIVVNQAALLGVVNSIDLDGKKLVVTEADTDREVNIPLGPKVALETTGGKAYHLGDIKTGDGVRIEYVGPDVTRVVVNVKPAELTGHVQSVAADLKSFVVSDVASGTDVKVIVTPDTVIVNGQGKTMGLKDLKKGDGVGIAHTSSVASKIVVNPAPAR